VEGGGDAGHAVLGEPSVERLAAQLDAIESALAAPEVRVPPLNIKGGVTSAQRAAPYALARGHALVPRAKCLTQGSGKTPRRQRQLHAQVAALLKCSAKDLRSRHLPLLTRLEWLGGAVGALSHAALAAQALPAVAERPTQHDMDTAMTVRLKAQHEAVTAAAAAQVEERGVDIATGMTARLSPRHEMATGMTLQPDAQHEMATGMTARAHHEIDTGMSVQMRRPAQHDMATGMTTRLSPRHDMATGMTLQPDAQHEMATGMTTRAHHEIATGMSVQMRRPAQHDTATGMTLQAEPYKEMTAGASTPAAASLQASPAAGTGSKAAGAGASTAGGTRSAFTLTLPLSDLRGGSGPLDPAIGRAAPSHARAHGGGRPPRAPAGHQQAAGGAAPPASAHATARPQASLDATAMMAVTQQVRHATPPQPATRPVGSFNMPLRRVVQQAPSTCPFVGCTKG
jgi:hypothetical protein